MLALIQDSDRPVTHTGTSFNLRRAMTTSTTTKSTRRPPHRTTEAQKQILMAQFDDDPNPSAMKRDRLAKLLKVERRIVKNWFSNQRALRRKTGQGYRGWMSGSVSSQSAYGSGDELEPESAPKPDDLPTNRPDVVNTTPSPPGSHEPSSPSPRLPNILRVTINAQSLRPLLPKVAAAAPRPRRCTRVTHPLASTTLANLSSSINLLPPATSSLPLAYPCSWLPSSSPAMFLHPIINRALQMEDELEEDTFSPSLLRGYPESALRSSLTV